jgi:hypothetical protein
MMKMEKGKSYWQGSIALNASCGPTFASSHSPYSKIKQTNSARELWPWGSHPRISVNAVLPVLLFSSGVLLSLVVQHQFLVRQVPQAAIQS